jgi:hypothetical protein
MRMLEGIHAFLSRALPRLFAFNVLVTARRLDSVEEVFGRTVNAFEETPAPAGRDGVEARRLPKTE